MRPPDTVGIPKLLICACQEDLALTSVDAAEKQRDFWWLFPSDGKTAVAKDRSSVGVAA